MAGIIGIVWAGIVAIVTLADRALVRLVAEAASRSRLARRILREGWLDSSPFFRYRCNCRRLIALVEPWEPLSCMLASGQDSPRSSGPDSAAHGADVQAREAGHGKDGAAADRWSQSAMASRTQPTKRATTMHRRMRTQPRFRFRIIHLLWVGVWLSLLLTAHPPVGHPLRIHPADACWAGLPTKRPRFGSAGCWRDGFGLGGTAGGKFVPRETTGSLPAACVFHVEHTNRGWALDDATREVVSRETEKVRCPWSVVRCDKRLQLTTTRTTD